MDVRIGSRFRALRQRLGWRQVDVARRAGVSQGLVSLIERGHLERVSLAHLRAVARALDAEFAVQLNWRAGHLDRLIDEGHAALVGAVVALLRRLGWQVRLEVSYSVYGERGSIDLLAWHQRVGALLVVEVKTTLTSVEETLRKHDEKARLAGSIASREFGWNPVAIGRLLVLPNLSTPRRQVTRHEAAFATAYPVRGAAARRWLASPTGRASALLFLDPSTGPTSLRKSRMRVRRAAA
ncbi:MAG: helix-turn-helix transcriptional regulator [Chloroflexi bacterium]|nr:helix-turn-helix transcriptional regulator [Chloroflexota bacterium]